MQPRRSPSHAFALVRKRKYDDSIKSEWEGDRLVSPTPEWWLVLHHPARHLKFSADGVEASDLFFLHCCSHVYPLTILLGFGAQDLGGKPPICDRERGVGGRLPAAKGRLQLFDGRATDRLRRRDPLGDRIGRRHAPHQRLVVVDLAHRVRQRSCVIVGGQHRR